MSYLNDDSLSYLISKIKDNFVLETELTNALVNYLRLDGSNGMIQNGPYDLNNFINGIGLFNNTNGSISNVPPPPIVGTTQDATWLVIASGNSSDIVQMAYPLRHLDDSSDDPLCPFIRYKNNNVWNNWIRLGAGALNCSSSNANLQGQYNLRIATDASQVQEGWITFVVGSQGS